VKFIFKYTLNSSEESEVIEFLEKQNYYSVLQNPKWDKIINKRKRSCYYISRNDQQIVAYALINESFLLANLMFGPVGIDSEQIAQSIIRIHEYYSKKGFARLEVQSPIPSGQLSEEIEYSVSKKISFKQAITKENWTSIEVPLSLDTDELIKSFSSNHKRSIAKSQKAGLKVELLAHHSETIKFGQLYDEMYKRRAIHKPFNDTSQVFEEIYNYFQNNTKGLFVGVYDTDNNFCGGACFTINSKKIMYQYGAISANSKYPVLHLAFWEVMKMAKELNLQSIDLCGVNLLVDESDQIYQINRFKFGFNGRVVYYPPKMKFILNCWKSLCYDSLKYIYSKLRRL